MSVSCCVILHTHEVHSFVAVCAKITVFARPPLYEVRSVVVPTWCSPFDIRHDNDFHTRRAVILRDRTSLLNPFRPISTHSSTMTSHYAASSWVHWPAGRRCPSLRMVYCRDPVPSPSADRRSGTITPPSLHHRRYQRIIRSYTILFCLLVAYANRVLF